MGWNISLKTATLSIISNTVLVLLKFVIWVVTWSVSIISEAIHSCLDLLAAIIAFFSVKYSSKKADDFHNYWYGKIENISWVIEALLIFVAIYFIVCEAAEKLFHPWNVQSLWLWFGVMIFSWVVNYFVSRRLFEVAKKTHSLALEADALHLRTDTYTSLWVWIGLFVVRISWWNILDPIVAILIALFIMKEAWDMLKKSFLPLLDRSIPLEDREIIRNIVLNFNWVDSIHKFYTRTVWNKIFIEFDLVFDSDDLTILQAHNIWWQIKSAIKTKYESANIRIHLEPFSCKRN